MQFTTRTFYAYTPWKEIRAIAPVIINFMVNIDDGFSIDAQDNF